MSWISSLQNNGISGLVNALESAVPGKSTTDDTLSEPNESFKLLEEQELTSRQETEIQAIEMFSIVMRRLTQTSWKISWLEDLWGELYIPTDLKSDFMEYLRERYKIEEDRHKDLAKLYYTLKQSMSDITSASNSAADAFINLIKVETDDRDIIEIDSREDLNSILSFKLQLEDDKSAFIFSEASARRQLISSENVVFQNIEIKKFFDLDDVIRTSINTSVFKMESVKYYGDYRDWLHSLTRKSFEEIKNLDSSEEQLRETIKNDFYNSRTALREEFGAREADATQAESDRALRDSQQLVEEVQNPETTNRTNIETSEHQNINEIILVYKQSEAGASKRHRDRLESEAVIRRVLLEQYLSIVKDTEELETSQRIFITNSYELHYYNTSQSEQRIIISEEEQSSWSGIWYEIVSKNVSGEINKIQLSETVFREELIKSEESKALEMDIEMKRQFGHSKREELMRINREADLIRTLGVREKQFRSTLIEEEDICLVLLDFYYFYIKSILHEYETTLTDLTSLKRSELISINERNQLLTQDLTLRITELTGMEKAERNFESEEESTRWELITNTFYKQREEITSELQQRNTIFAEAVYSLQEHEVENRGHISLSEEANYWEVLQLEQTQKCDVPTTVNQIPYYTMGDIDDDSDQQSIPIVVPDWDDQSEQSKQSTDWCENEFEYVNHPIMTPPPPVNNKEMTSEVVQQVEVPQLIDTILTRFHNQNLFSSPLHVAIQSDDFLSVMAVIEAIQKGDQRVPPPSTVSVNDVPIMMAVKGSCLSSLRALLSDPNIANVRYCDKEGKTALHHAVEMQRVAAVILLLEGHAPVNAADGAGWSPFHLSASLGNKIICELLYQHGADSSLQSHDGRTPGHLWPDKTSSTPECLLHTEITIEPFNDHSVPTSPRDTPASPPAVVSQLSSFIYNNAPISPYLGGPFLFVVSGLFMYFRS